MHPSGTPLRYEGDAPEDRHVGERPKRDRTTLDAAFRAALEAAGIDVSTEKGATPGGGVRRQTTRDAAARALGEAFRQVVSGESVRWGSNAGADPLAFRLGRDADQAARVPGAPALAAAEVAPAEAERHAETLARAMSRARGGAARRSARGPLPRRGRCGAVPSRLAAADAGAAGRDRPPPARKAA